MMSLPEEVGSIYGQTDFEFTPGSYLLDFSMETKHTDTFELQIAVNGEWKWIDPRLYFSVYGSEYYGILIQMSPEPNKLCVIVQDSLFTDRRAIKFSELRKYKWRLVKMAGKYRHNTSDEAWLPLSGMKSTKPSRKAEKLAAKETQAKEIETTKETVQVGPGAQVLWGAIDFDNLQTNYGPSGTKTDRYEVKLEKQLDDVTWVQTDKAEPGEKWRISAIYQSQPVGFGESVGSEVRRLHKEIVDRHRHISVLKNQISADLGVITKYATTYMIICVCFVIAILAFLCWSVFS